ncbi:MAG: hypothetical protein ACP5D9_11640 [Mariniphaga sp.]
MFWEKEALFVALSLKIKNKSLAGKTKPDHRLRMTDVQREWPGMEVRFSDLKMAVMVSLKEKDLGTSISYKTG